MKKSIAAIVAALMVLGAFAGTAVARDGGKKAPALIAVAQASYGKAPAIHVEAGMVRVPNRPKSHALTVTAVAHFSTGDVTVALKVHGRSLVATGKLPIPAGNTSKTVRVDVVAILDGTTYTVSKNVHVRVPKVKPTPTPTSAPTLAPVPTPEPTPTPEPSPTNQTF